MFENGENGYFSRFAFFTFDVERKWHSQRPTENSRSLIESVESASQELCELYKRLNERDKPLYIDLTPNQWDNIDETFSSNMQTIEDLNLSAYLHASNNRAALLALRMASLFTVLRADGEDIHQIVMKNSLTPTTADMEAAVKLAQNFIEHATRLYYILPKSESTDAKGERYQQWLALLPQKFETEDAHIAGDELGIPKRTVDRWLSSGKNVKRIERGKYKKTM